MEKARSKGRINIHRERSKYMQFFSCHATLHLLVPGPYLWLMKGCDQSGVANWGLTGHIQPTDRLVCLDFCPHSVFLKGEFIANILKNWDSYIKNLNFPISLENCQTFV